jgi:hypothetical protein
VAASAGLLAALLQPAAQERDFLLLRRDDRLGEGSQSGSWPYSSSARAMSIAPW